VKSSVRDYKYKYYLAMKRLMMDAAGVFAESAIQRVHVDTGMSAASLEPFAKAAKTSIIGQVAPRRVRKGMTSISGFYYKNRFKSIPEGLKAGKTAYRFNFGTKDRPYMSFRFSIKVWQYMFWESRWQSLLNAQIDAEVFIENNYSKYLPAGLNKLFKFTGGVNY